MRTSRGRQGLFQQHLPFPQRPPLGTTRKSRHCRRGSCTLPHGAAWAAHCPAAVRHFRTTVQRLRC